jgi:hypothetical protein
MRLPPEIRRLSVSFPIYAVGRTPREPGATADPVFGDADEAA